MLRLLTSLLGATLVAAAAGPAARADQVTAVRFGAHPDKTRIVVETSAPVQARIFTLDGPAERLVIELPRGAGFSVPGLDGRGRSTVPGVSSFVFDDRAEAPRLIFHLDGPNAVRETLRLGPAAGGGYRTVVDIAPVSRDAFVQASGFSRADDMGDLLTQLVRERAAPEPQQAVLAPSCAVVRVVIDPGHGGRDPGAPARFGGGHEKDVNLAAGLILHDLLEATGRYDAVMTRDTDVFIDLHERPRIARELEADLFISLHANASPDASRSAGGASVMSMNGRALDRARRQAQNDGDWAERGRPPIVTEILRDMTISQKVEESDRFAELLLTEVGRTRSLWRDQIDRANLAVLIDSQIPAVLFEMGFLTNPDDARMLNDERHLRRLMNAVVAAVDGHFVHCGGGDERTRYIASAAPGRNAAGAR
ncbi:MAG: N-acetylmuramoyl-L-alanine amidase [Oceanicaulis sp.]